MKNTLTAKITWTTSPNKIQAQVNYGVFDSKGRELGHELTIDTKKSEPRYEPNENGNCVFVGMVVVDGIFAKSQSTRNGVQFGASFPKEYRMKSIEEAKEFLFKQALKFEKQIKAKALKNGGIYK